MKRATAALVLWLSTVVLLQAQSFAVRGVLPWHNFLSGPTSWNENDYAAYLDTLESLQVNFIGFHVYTGGLERYAPYVEPLIKIQYRNVLPHAFLDNSLTARWGYRPMAVKDFPFGTSRLFALPEGAEAFGADVSILAKSDAECYHRAQALMQKVIELAHSHRMQVAIGFEFGVHPPELASIQDPASYWNINGAVIPDPLAPDNIEILHTIIDNILQTYPGVDWIWLWLHEHSFMPGTSPRIAEGDAFARYRDQNRHWFPQLEKDQGGEFSAVWSLAYIRQAYDYIRSKSPATQVVVGGWGGGAQLPRILQGLDAALPPDIVFSCLNPDGGSKPHPASFREIAGHRSVWAMPWLESDYDLWHLQPRVGLIRDQVRRAREDGMQGVVAIHWRTEEVRLNLEAFCHFAVQPMDTLSTAEIYRRDVSTRYGAVASLASMLIDMDASQWLASASSPEYYPYSPLVGRLTEEQKRKCVEAMSMLDRLLLTAEHGARKNLLWLRANFLFALQLDLLGIKMEPAFQLKSRWLTGNKFSVEEYRFAAASLAAAPMQELLTTFAERVRSRGELGELSALNQKVWGTYWELEKFLREQQR